jgi:hypothetical protein
MANLRKLVSKRSIKSTDEDRQRTWLEIAFMLTRALWWGIQITNWIADNM